VLLGGSLQRKVLPFLSQKDRGGLRNSPEEASSTRPFPEELEFLLDYSELLNISFN